jgi:hypothetical protein
MVRQIGILLAIFIGLIAVFIFAERSFSPAFKQCISTQQTNESGGAPKESPSVFGATVDSYVECTGGYLNDAGPAITALATIIIAAFTGTLWIATSRQSELTREALAADKRAFVFAKGLGSFWELDEQTGFYNWRFRPSWENSGETPTSRMTMCTECELRNTPLPSDFEFRHDPTHTGNGLIGPKTSIYGGIAPQSPAAAISPFDILDIEQGKKFLYLWGWIRYHDVFPGTPHHITRFAWAIVAVGDPFAYNPRAADKTVAFSNIYLPRGNCADDDCILQGFS